MSNTRLGNALVLRPYKRFELDYDTKAGTTPIQFAWPPNPNDVAIAAADPYRLDALSRQGVAGYSPNLALAVSCPIGASLLFYIPSVTEPAQASADSPVYVWSFVYRLRNLSDYRHDGRPYSLGKSGNGTPDLVEAIIYPGTDPQRVVIPSCRGGSVYLRREPSLSANNTNQVQSIQYAWPENIAMPGYTGINTGYGGHYEQGVFNASFGVGSVEFPAYPHWEKAHGNEVAVICQKFVYSTATDLNQWVPGTWDFQYNPVTGICNPLAEDIRFSQAFGVGDDGVIKPDIGVYMVAGEPSV